MMLQQTHQSVSSPASNSVDASQHVPLFTIFTWNSWHCWLCNLFIPLPRYLPSASLPKLKKESTQVVDSQWEPQWGQWQENSQKAILVEFPESHAFRNRTEDLNEPRERLTGFIPCRS